MIYRRDLPGKGKARYLIKTLAARMVDCSETTEPMVALWWASDFFQHFLPLISLGMIYLDLVLKPPLTLDTFSVVRTTEPTRATLRRQGSSNFNGCCASWCSSCSWASCSSGETCSSHFEKYGMGRLSLRLNILIVVYFLSIIIYKL